MLAPTPSCSPDEPFSRAGTTFFRHGSIPAERDEVSLYELSSRGGLVMRKLGRPTEDPQDTIERLTGAPRAGRAGFEWQPDVARLAEAKEHDAEAGEIPVREAREAKQVDLRQQYEGE